MQDTRKTLIEILEIINYQKDRDKFANEFITLCVEHAFDEILKEHPVEKHKELEDRLSKVTNIDEFVGSFKDIVDSDRLKTSIEQVSARLFQDYITTIMPTLDPARKEKLLNYLASLSEITPPAGQS